MLNNNFRFAAYTLPVQFRFSLRLAILSALVATAASAQTASFAERGEEARRAGRIAEALRLQREGAERGEPRAQWLLSKMFAFGVGTGKDQERAAFWRRKAAEMGEVEAQAALGIDFFELKGQQRDNAQASYWCRQAAEQGDADAQACLGKLYEEGRGVFRDPTRAAEWFRKSAEQRNASGAMGLAQLHASGSGVAKDLVEALKWAFAARDLGVPTPGMDAPGRRIFEAELRSPQVFIASIQRQIDQAQLERARQRAQEWLAAAPPPKPAPRVASAGDWARAKSFCGDTASLALPENEAGLKAMSGAEKIVYQEQAAAQQVTFLDNGRAVILQDRQPKFLCSYALTGQAGKLTCPLSSYEIAYVSGSEIRLKASGTTALQTVHGLAQRMRSDVGACKSLD